MKYTFFILLIFIFKFRLLAIILNNNRSIPFSYYIVLLITLALRRSIDINDFRILIFNLKIFRILEEYSPPSRDLREVSSISRYIYFYRF